MQHENDGAVLALVELGQQIEHLDLVGQAEERGGLVQQHQPGALGERQRDPHPLALPARQLLGLPNNERITCLR